MKAFNAAALICALVSLLAGTALAVNIETVTVGDPGNSADTAAHSGNPAGQGAVGYTYNIGKYEVTAGQYCEFLNAVAATDTYGLYEYQAMSYGCGITRIGSSGSYWYILDTAYANRPVNRVSYWDACRFANWLSNGQPTGAQGPTTTERGTYTLDGYKGVSGRTIQRNPGSAWAVTSEDEWYKAAYYKGGSTNAGYWDYPTCSNTVPGRDLNDASGNNAGYSGILQWPYPTTMVGEFQNSDSPYGTFDQGGNVWEWNEAVVYQGPVAHRGLRGGEFGSNSDALLASYRFCHPPSAETYGIGFRIVQLPEPGCALLLIASLFGLACRRGRG